ncbi:lytic transglycosylase domain-containing protein [Thermodesulfobacterium hydrogeniphilum]|uniref:lytic transglycosylase domain-containing protein n=1 Tax=Thermodesulfobacterium hydrogeniphilum TaxID=161156 RepID=UPI000A069367|nr:lytic transglycosylase domain-containing protein [Thermodesulfobacterium hydrogeniphilum]
MKKLIFFLIFLFLISYIWTNALFSFNNSTSSTSNTTSNVTLNSTSNMTTSNIILNEISNESSNKTLNMNLSNNTVSNKTSSENFENFKEVYETFEELPPEVIINLPPDINNQVAYFLHYYTTRGKKGLQKWFNRCGPFLPYFKTIFKEYNIPEDLVYLALIESGCNPFAVSRAGAVGIWQFMKGTAKKYGLKINYWIDERKDFIKSTYAAAKYLKDLYQLFGDWRPAVASYNLGEGRLLRILKAKNFIDYWQVMRSNRLPLETMTYLPQWMAITLIAKNPQKYGFKPIVEKPVDYKEIKVNGGIDLKVFTAAGKIDYKKLLILNAELRRNITPPKKIYNLKIPYGKDKEFQKNLKNIKLIKVRKWTPYGIIRIITIPRVAFRGLLRSSKAKK